ncbi:nitric oxide-sensing protein NosP [Rheinheimera sp.]|uniref:nitric oxide-sensing protein NosP n=1 Tax=Rheinheimera sp. TaxID=1869214 RepID=UPI004048B33C
MSVLYQAVSYQIEPQAIAAELVRQLPLNDIDFIVVFCPASDRLHELSQALCVAFGEVRFAGCTTAGEITPDGYCNNSVLAIGFDRRHFCLQAAQISSLADFSLPDAQRLVNDLLQRDHSPQPRQEGFVMTFLDGLSSQEERVLLTLETALGRIPHFGGSAGDNQQLKRTHVLVHGQFRTDAAVVIFVRTNIPFRVFSTHHMRPTTEKLVVTAASADMRTLYELNAEPAAQAYADLLGINVAALDEHVFALHPLAVRIGQEFYVRSIQRVNADGSLTFFCAVGVGAVLTRMQPQPLLPDLADTLTELAVALGPLQAVLGCDCVLRRFECSGPQALQRASEFLQQHRVLGFNTYGEHYEGVHLNQTFTGVAFGTVAS